MPLWPYCFQVRLEGISVLSAVPIAVMHLAEGARHRLARQLLQLGLGIEEIDVAGAAFHEEPDHALGFGKLRWKHCSWAGLSRFLAQEIAEGQRRSHRQHRVKNSRRDANRLTCGRYSMAFTF